MADIIARSVLIFVLLSLILYQGCVQQPVCNKPYLLVGSGCCLDRNENDVCDSDEGSLENLPSRASGMVVLSHDPAESVVPVASSIPEGDEASGEEMSATTSTTEPSGPISVLSIVYTGGNRVSPRAVQVDGMEISPSEGNVFPLNDAAPGVHRLDVSVGAYTYHENFTYSGGIIQVALDPMSQVKGVVQNKSGGFLQGVNVYCDETLAGTSDVSGSFEFSVKCGNHTILLKAPGVYEVGVHELLQEYVSLTYSLERKYSINVSVSDTDTGDPVSEARVRLDVSTQEKTDPNGVALFNNVSEGTHFVEASYGSETIRRSVLVEQEGQFVGLSLSIPRNVTLRVIDKASGDAVSGAGISLDGEDIGSTGSDGTVLLGGFSGEAKVRVTYQDVDTTHVLEYSSDKSVYTLKIDVPHDITLEIKDSGTGRAVQGWDILLEGTKLQRSGTGTDSEGKTVLKSIIPGTYDLKLHDPGTGVNVSYANSLSVGTMSDVSVSLVMPQPKYSGEIKCSEYGVFNKMGRCNVSVSNVECENGMSSYDADVFLFVYTRPDQVDTGWEYAGQHLMHISSLSPGETYRMDFDPLSEFEGSKKEAVIAFILEDWRYSQTNEVSVGEEGFPGSRLEDLVEEIKERCMDDSSECGAVRSKTIAGILYTEN